ncbi:MAG: hypothetical protein JRH20_23680, partial [Deltaproteobacteria bacterium]|nr:hypothetical protein [Deltaproteobacteria bacterium]
MCSIGVVSFLTLFCFSSVANAENLWARGSQQWLRQDRVTKQQHRKQAWGNYKNKCRQWGRRPTSSSFAAYYAYVHQGQKTPLMKMFMAGIETANLPIYRAMDVDQRVRGNNRRAQMNQPKVEVTAAKTTIGVLKKPVPVPARVPTLVPPAVTAVTQMLEKKLIKTKDVPRFNYAAEHFAATLENPTAKDIFQKLKHVVNEEAWATADLKTAQESANYYWDP